MRITYFFAVLLLLTQVSCTLTANISKLGSLDGLGTEDQTPPQLKIDFPLENELIDSAKVSSSIFSGTCSEEGLPVKMEVYYNTTDAIPAISYNSVCNSGSVTFSPDLVSLNDAFLYVYFKQTDNAGNTGKSAPLKINKQANGPTVNFISSPSANVITSTIQVTVTFSDTVTGFDASQLAASNGIVQNFSGSGSSYTFDFVPAAEGSASVSILSGVVKDSYNNLLPSGYVLNKYYDKDIVRAYFQELSSVHTEGNQSVSRTILLTGTKPYDMSVHIDVLGNAISGVDYSSSSFDVTIPANTNQVSFNVNLSGNSTLDQGDRSLFLSISDTSSPMLKVKEFSYSRINILEDDKTIDYGPVEDVTLGYFHTCIKHQSGVIKCWGGNSGGNLGIGSTVSTTTPTVVDAGVNYSMISSGARASCGIVAITNKLKCWGYNGYGEVGDGTYTQRNSPVAVDSGTDYLKVVVGGSANGGPTACGITTANDLKCWGDNGYGQYGNGTFSSNITPTLVQGGTKYSDISMGGLFACGITTAGQLRCWGSNWYSNLGDGGTYADSNSPLVIDSGVTYSKVSAGGYHACAITTSGVLKCWGKGNASGINSTIDALVPTVVDAGVSYSHIAVGEEGGCGITTLGVLKCWGGNKFGQVGDPNLTISSTTYQLTPIVIDAGVTYSKVSMQRAWAGGSSSTHTCGVTSDGNLKCWGANPNGQLAQVTVSTLPSIISNETFSSFSTYPGRLVGIATSGKSFALGVNDYGEFADSQFTPYLFPFRLSSDTYSSFIISYSSCGISATQDLYCWGYNQNAELGDGTTVNKSSPVLIDAGTKYVKVVGDYTKCGITTTGVLKCWGYNLYGTVGDGTTVNKTTPVIIDAGTNYSDVKMNSFTACGITTVGALKCWGYNSAGQVGDGTTVNKVTPTLINSGTSYSIIEVGGYLNCGITTTGVLKCWGANNLYGAVGDGTLVNKTTPTIINSGTSYSSVSPTIVTTCAITTTGVLKCWGRNDYGAVGDGSIINRTTPVTVDSGVSYSSVFSSGLHVTCGITSAGVLKCWGRNDNGAVGDGTLTMRTSPVTVDGGTLYSKVISNSSTPGTCGLTQAGKLKCWGPTVYLQTVKYNSPTLVLNVR